MAVKWIAGRTGSLHGRGPPCVHFGEVEAKARGGRRCARGQRGCPQAEALMTVGAWLLCRHQQHGGQEGGATPDFDDSSVSGVRVQHGLSTIAVMALAACGMLLSVAKVVDVLVPALLGPLPEELRLLSQWSLQCHGLELQALLAGDAAVGMWMEMSLPKAPLHIASASAACAQLGRRSTPQPIAEGRCFAGAN